MTTDNTNEHQPFDSRDFSHSLFGPKENGNTQGLIAKLPFDPDTVFDSVAIDAGSKEYTPTYRNKKIPERLICNLHPALSTYDRLFENSVKLYGNQPCLGSRKYDYKRKVSEESYESFTYKEVDVRRKNLGSGILYVLKSNPFKRADSETHAKIDNHERHWTRYGKKHGEREDNTSFVVSILSPNRPEWVLTDLACSAYSMTNTALYDTLGPDAAEYILQLTKSPVVVCPKDKIRSVIDLKRASPDTLKHLISIVSMDLLFEDDDPLIYYAHDSNITVFDMNETERLGETHFTRSLPPTAETMYTISFTSGTTGSSPKGVMLTHENAVTAISSLACAMPQVDHGKAFIFLPLTHIYERETSGFALSTGYYLGFPQLTVDKLEPVNPFVSLLEDLRIFKPTYLSLVPRILTRIESMIKSEIANSDAATRNLLNEIILNKSKVHGEFDGSDGFDSKYDNHPAYKRLRSLVGFDNLLLTLTGSAPIAPSSIVFLKASLNIGLRQMYGLTESFGGISLSSSYESKPGSCGSVVVGCEMKLKTLPGMDYFAQDNKGELLLRGPQIFKGYYHNKDETNKAIDDEGWFQTGDVGKINPDNGRLYIIDRVKNFFKLAQGEYVSPEKVENVYLSSNPILAQLYVHGDSLQSYLVGIVGIEYDPGLKFLHDSCGYKSAKITPEEMLVQVNRVENKRKFLKAINSTLGNRLQGFEKLNNIHIEINPLTVDRNVVTPTLKIKRASASKFFGDIFSRLYLVEKSLVAAKSKL